MERQSHDEHQAAETLRIVDVSVLDGEAPGFEVGELRWTPEFGQPTEVS
jgi:hypothetical protein